MTAVNEENLIDLVASEVPSEDQTPKTVTVTVPVGEAAEEGDLESIVGKAPITGVVTAVSYTPKAAQAESATLYRTYSLVNLGQTDAGTAVAATLSTKEGSGKKEKLLAAVSRAFGLGTGTALNVVAGDVLQFKNIHTGKVLADKGGLLSISVARVVHAGPANNANQAQGFEGSE